ncbi:MAG: hypothetical protein HY046_13975, partial [Acidobacteria bacterium]|nr:hypothetical protein [Acidobacteriota bacterium]
LVLSLSAIFGVADSGASPESALEQKKKLVSVINHDRAAARLTPVEYSEELSAAADQQCQEMLREQYASHWNMAGWKPYLRYSQAGISDSTAENLFSLRHSNFPATDDEVWLAMETGHRGFMAERPPADGHRQAVLGPMHQRVGIGLAFDRTGLRMIEVFGTRLAEIAPGPKRARVKAQLRVEGFIPNSEYSLFAISVFYEPLPAAMSRLELQSTGSYSFPEQEQIERVRREGRMYVDGTEGIIEINAMGRFSMPLRLWRNQPGVYTVAVWVSRKGGKAFIGASRSIIVEP